MTIQTISYEVTLRVDPALAPALEAYMRREHIPAILRTGCFREIRFDQASADVFRTSYRAQTREDLDRYLQDYAPALREDFQTHFPKGVTLSREVWTPLESWESRE
jgi:hypothetical protein